MEASDFSAFASFMAEMGEYYQKEIPNALTELYWQDLKAFDKRAIEQAFCIHRTMPQRGDFMPRPSHLIALIQGDPETRALQAWSKVLTAVRRVGVYDSVAFDDALIHAVLSDMGGWVAFCHTQQDTLSYVTHHFIKCYSAYARQAPLHYPAYLSGLIEQQNRFQGFPYPVPTLIGELKQARCVLQHGGTRQLHIERPPSLVQPALEEVSYDT